MTRFPTPHSGAPSPYAGDPAVRRATRVAGAAVGAVAGLLLIATLGLVVVALANPRYLAVLVIALLPGVLGFGLFTSSMRILRGEILGTGRATMLLGTMASLLSVGTISALTAGDGTPAMGMGISVVVVIVSLILVSRAERALKGLE